MSQKPSKSAAELENIIMTELLGYPECDGAGVVVVKQIGTLLCRVMGPDSIRSATRGSPKSIIDFAESSI
jgi:hypothetical protein